MNKITINGNTYSGNNVVISNGKVIIDGKDFTPETKIINIHVEGNIDELKVDNCNKLLVNGNAKNIKTQSGSVEVSGAVSGDIRTISGSVNCGDVNSYIQTTSGSVECGKVGGKINTISGSVKHKGN